VVAPGGSKATGIQILSTWWDEVNKRHGYGRGSGNSQATAHVTATCALALQLNHRLSFEEVRDVLQRAATELIDPSTRQPYPRERQGAGLINADEVDEAVKRLN
jgi:subtilisin family serine protease